jgi:outer membrane immunogenic protein
VRPATLVAGCEAHAVSGHRGSHHLAAGRAAEAERSGALRGNGARQAAFLIAKKERQVRQIGIAAALLATIAGPALAVDPIALPVTGDSTLAVHDSEGFDWNGFYAGVYGTVTDSAATDVQYGLGVNAGFSHAFDFVLVGGEVAFHPLGNANVATGYLQAVWRGGVLVTDNVLLFGATGFGTDTGPVDDNHVLAGGGIELGVTDSLSLRGQYLHGFPVTNANPIEQVTFGAEFHF